MDLLAVNLGDALAAQDLLPVFLRPVEVYGETDAEDEAEDASDHDFLDVEFPLQFGPSVDVISVFNQVVQRQGRGRTPDAQFTLESHLFWVLCGRHLLILL